MLEVGVYVRTEFAADALPEVAVGLVPMPLKVSLPTVPKRHEPVVMFALVVDALDVDDDLDVAAELVVAEESLVASRLHDLELFNRMVEALLVHFEVGQEAHVVDVQHRV